MLKRSITYTDFNDQQVTEVFYFNLSKSELVEMEVSTKEGFGETLKRIVEIEDRYELIKEFKTIILAAYGEKSPDGKSFNKTDELRAAFAQTAAYDALFFELATQPEAIAAFIKGCMPADMGKTIEATINEDMKAKFAESGTIVGDLFPGQLPPPPPAA